MGMSNHARRRLLCLRGDGRWQLLLIRHGSREERPHAVTEQKPKLRAYPSTELLVSDLRTEKNFSRKFFLHGGVRNVSITEPLRMAVA